MNLILFGQFSQFKKHLHPILKYSSFISCVVASQIAFTTRVVQYLNNGDSCGFISTSNASRCTPIDTQKENIELRTFQGCSYQMEKTLFHVRECACATRIFCNELADADLDLEDIKTTIWKTL